MDWSPARRPPAPLGLAPNTVCHSVCDSPQSSSFWDGRGGGGRKRRGPAPSWKLPLTYMTTCCCHVQPGEPQPQITQLGLTFGGPVMHHVYSLTYTGVGFSCPCYALINTHARTRVIKRPDGCAPAADVVCAVWPLTDVAAAFGKHCSLTECRPSIKQITTLLLPPLSPPTSASPNPSLPAPNSSPKIVQIHNGS